MRLLANTGDERVVDELRAVLAAGSNLDIATPSFSVFAFQEIRNLLARLTKSRMVLPPLPEGGLGLLGGEADRSGSVRTQGSSTTDSPSVPPVHHAALTCLINSRQRDMNTSRRTANDAGVSLILK